MLANRPPVSVIRPSGRLHCLALAGVLVIGVPTSNAAAAPGKPITIIFQGTYVLSGNASQPAFKAGSRGCVPAVVQKETISAHWTIRFRTASLPANGSMTLTSREMTITGSHVWDEASSRCAAFPSGHLVCRTEYLSYPQTLSIEASGSGLAFHPALALNATSTGEACKGEVYNEHPDCGARDAAGITDFAFVGALQRLTPTLANGRETIPFNVIRSRSCAKAGKRNPGTIRQAVSARYEGTFSVER